MKVKVEKGGPCRKTLVVELPAEDVSAEYRKVADDFTGLARIPGFRKGRAPAKLVESHFSKEIREEVNDRLVGRTYPEALKQAQLKPLMILDLKAEAESGKPLVYRVILDIPPEFKLPRYKNIPVSRKPVAVTEDDLQKALGRLRERFATTEQVAGREARPGDLAQVDYTLKDDRAADSKAGGKQPERFVSGRDFWVALGEEDRFLPGFAAAVEGMAIGSRKEIELQLPAELKMPQLAGRKVAYQVHLKALRERKMPEMNDQFFQSVGVKSEAELHEKMRATLLAEAERAENERRKNEIIEHLLAKTAFDLPESIVQEETRHMFASIARERLMRGSTREQLATQRDEILSLATKSAAEKVKLGYILHKIGEEEKIAVAENEVAEKIRNMSGRYGLSAEELKKELEEKKEIDSIRHEIRMGKILDFLLAGAAEGAKEEKGIIGRIFKGGD